MNRYPILFCLLFGFAFACPAANGQSASDHPRVPAPVDAHVHLQTATQGTVHNGAESVSAVEVSQSPPANTAHWAGSHSHHGHSFNHPGVAHIGTGTQPLQASYSLHRSGDNFYCPLKLMHVPYGVWIEIQETWYQHKSLDVTMDVCVNFEMVPSSFQPSIIIRSASNPSEVRQSETSMSKSILLIPGQTVEFDYAREFGEQLRKKLSRSEQESIARMLHAETNSTPFNRMVSAPILANQELQPDQIASIQIAKVAASIELSARSTVWDVSPTNGPLLTLRAGTRLLSSLAPNVRLKANVKSSYVNGAKETISKTFVVYVEGELGRGRVSETMPDKAEIDCMFDFNRLFNNNSEFASYIGSARNSGQVECTFSDVKLEFYNNRFDKAITNKFDGIAVESFTLKLDLKFPK